MHSHAGAWERGNRPYMIILSGHEDGSGRLILHFTASLRSLRINLPPPPKGKKVKIQNLRCPGEAKPKADAQAAQRKVATIRGPTVPGATVPATATIHPARAR